MIDYDELLTGKRREAQFTALWSIFPKFVMVPGAAVPLAVLGSIGYVPNAVQTPEVVLAIKSLFAFGTASFSSLALLIAWQLPMTEPVHRAILRAVERRARGELVVDPVTGRALAPRDGSFDEASGWFLDHFSAGELRRSLGRGPGILVRDVVASGSVALATSAAAAAFVLRELSNPLREPGVLAVGGVVVSGFSLAIVCFHALRLRAALRLVRNPAPDAELRAHLDRLATRGERSLASRRSGARADSQPG